MSVPNFLGVLFSLFMTARLFAIEPSTTTATETPIDPETLIVHEIKLEGLKNIREHLIRSQIKTRKGVVFDSIEAKNDSKRLMGIGVFASADVRLTTTTIENQTYLEVNFLFVEKPKIKKLHILGNKALSKGTLKDLLAPSKTEEHEHEGSAKTAELRNEIGEGAYFDDVKLSDALERIKAKYEEKSIFGTDISVEKKLNEENNTLELFLNFSEGKKTKIVEINLTGFTFYKTKKILKTLKVKPRKSLNLQKVSKGIQTLTKSYKEEGWLDFTLTMSTETVVDVSTQIKINPKELPIKVYFTADEGKRHYLLDYHFEGNELITTKRLEELASLPKNAILKESRLEEAKANIVIAYHNEGRLYATIDVEKRWSQDREGLDLVFRIEERNPVYIGSIYVEGLTKTKDYVIKREILLKEGDLFNRKRLERSQEKIFNLGFLEDIKVDPQPTPNPNYVDLIFDVKEGRPGMLTAGAGFSSIDGLVGTVSLQHLNLLGRAQRLNLSTEFGRRRQSYDVTWTTPWTFERRMSTSLSAFNTNRALQYATDTTAFKKRSKGGSVFFGPRFEEDTIMLGFGYTLQKDQIYDVLPIYRNDIPELALTRSAVNLRASYDTRDYRWDPTRGTEQTANTEIAGGLLGGNVYLVKPTLTHALHLPTFKIGRRVFVLSNALRWGAVKEFGGITRTVPISDRFYVGGAETVRGYTYTGQIGPIEGGRFFLVGNMEYKIPLVMEGRLTVIQGALFLDFGGAWRGTRNVNLNFGRNPNNLKAGIGFGIRFKTPAFPVRLDWGWGLHHAPGESISQFYFTIGSIL